MSRARAPMMSPATMNPALSFPVSSRYRPVGVCALLGPMPCSARPICLTQPSPSPPEADLVFHPESARGSVLRLLRRMAVRLRIPVGRNPGATSRDSRQTPDSGVDPPETAVHMLLWTPRRSPRQTAGQAPRRFRRVLTAATAATAAPAASSHGPAMMTGSIHWCFTSARP
jgi:hypothetical protein